MVVEFKKAREIFATISKPDGQPIIVHDSDYTMVVTTTGVYDITVVDIDSYITLKARLPITFFSYDEELLDYTIYGRTSQQNIGVGDYDETTGKYIIPVTVTNSNSETITTNLLSDSMLLDGDSMSMVDFGETIGVHIGQNAMTVGTVVQPSTVKIVYRGVEQ